MLASLFDYKIMERAIASSLISLIIFIFFGSKIINFLKSIGLGQRVSQWGPRSHFSKEGTPTAGGFFIFLTSLIATIIFGDLTKPYLTLSLLTFALFTFLGLLDDVLKKKSKKRGLTISQKFALQILISIIIISITYNFVGLKPSLKIPYTDSFLDLPMWLYIILCVFIIVGSSNAVNLTDGIDGLAGGHTLISFAVSTVFLYLSGHLIFAKYLNLFFVNGIGEVVILCSAIQGAILGFLWWNSYPAQVFMGDSGSLSLGALLGYISIIGKFELFLPIFGFLFVVEAISVIIQVTYFKITKGKRVFRMAPLHHHFELGGTSEPKVTARFLIIGIIFAAIALFGIKGK